MGQCTSSRSRKITQKQTQQYWKEPIDTQFLANTSLTKLQFQGTLANLKIINCQYPSISVKVQIKGVDTFLLRSKKLKADLTANWVFQHKFQFQMTEYELRKSFVEIYVYNEAQLLIGELKVNLYLISSGPYHQNFKIPLKKGINTRIHFDLKISQIIEIHLDSNELELDLVTKHPGQKFSYSIKPIVGHHGQLNASAPSYTVKVKLDDKQNINTNSSQNTRKLTIKNAQKLIAEGHNLVWTKTDQLPMPSIFMKTLVSELHHCYFQILFWKISHRNSEFEQQASELFAQCYVALHKIFDIQSTSFSSENGFYEKRFYKSEDKLWHNGQQIGKVIFKFQVISDKYIKQMQVMVRTEYGIQKYSPVIFNNSSEKKKSSCKQLQQLIKIQQQIYQLAMQLQRIQNQQKQGFSIQVRKLKVNIQQNLQKLLSLLEKSYQTNLIIYQYSSSNELMKAQQIFLNLGFKTMGYLEQQDFHINDLCWDILTAIMARGQFILAHVGFDELQKSKMQANRIDKRLQTKIQIALTYNEFMSKLLRIAVDSLSVRGLQLEKNYAQICCAYAYFRVKNFRGAILEAFTRSNDPELPEWRGIQFSLQQDIDYGQIKTEVNTFTALFDWLNNFHKCLQNYERYQISDNLIYDIIMREDWKFRLSKRGISFFQFIKCWIQYVQLIVIKQKDIQWKYFPGYNKLLKCFLTQMKKRSILQYPDILKASLFKLLVNQKLLNPIIAIIFKKANIYQPFTVIRAIVLISEIFTILYHKNKKIPSTFNYFNFYEGLKIIFQSQNSFAISKTIIMLYNYFKIFNLQFRRNISMLLLGKVFFKLFLHWSYNVRHVFYHLLMRIYHQSLRIDHSQLLSNQQQVNQEVRKRYQSLMQMLQNLVKLNKQKRRVQYFTNIEKDLHKKLKKNLEYKRKKRIQAIGKQQSIKIQCPGSPSSQRILKSPIINQRFQLYKGHRNQIFRSQSQVLRPTIKLAEKISFTQKQQQIKVMNNKTTSNFRHRIYDNTKGEKVLIKTSINEQNKYDEDDFKIAKIENNLLQYIQEAMYHFNATNQIFTKNFNNKAWELPKIKMEMPLDSRQIRPQEIDNW